jgi:hypothetical protein
VTACPTRLAPDERQRAVHGTNVGNSEPDRESRLAQLRMGNDREVTSEPSLSQTSLHRLLAGSKRDVDRNSPQKRNSDVGAELTQLLTPMIPAESDTLPAAANGHRERSNPQPSLPRGSSLSGARWLTGRIGPEANAFGKAGGHADGATDS